MTVIKILYVINFSMLKNSEKSRDNSAKGRSPALGVRPGQDSKTIESSIISFNYQHQKDELAVPGYKVSQV